MVRIKNRYLLVNFLYPTTPTSATNQIVPEIVHFHKPSPDELTIPYFTKVIRDSVNELYGEYGVGAVSVGLSIRYLSAATSTAIIRAPRNHYRLVWGALSFISKLPKPVNQDCVIRVVRVSGTIRKAENELISRAKETIRRAQIAAEAMSKGVDDYMSTSSTNRAEHQDPEVDDDDDMEDEEDEDGQDEDEDMGVVLER